MIIEIQNPDVKFMPCKDRSDGLSGFIRCKNEGEFLEQVIDSWIDLVDELIVVFNDSSDNTEEILTNSFKKYPQKLKAYHYLPKVFSQGSDNFKELEEDDYQSLVNYYNFTLSKTTKKWALKIDGDIILDKEKIPLIKECFSKLKDNEFIKLSGINIIMQNSKIYCLSESIFCGLNGDLCIFKMSDEIKFKKGKTCEYLNFPKKYTFYSDENFKVNNSLTAYYHMKFQKKDFGFGVYDFKNNKNSNYYPKTWIFIVFSRLILLDEIFKKYDIKMSDPLEFINFNKNYSGYKKEFIHTLKTIEGGEQHIFVA
ncbi:hypothetical protein F1B92_00065 [Campylobacter sp. FMV-PI01]|uniref:Glycosyltransferase family 2 protein n=1 Tax=Campylobacter portucalensis TaxID=2608384 RepID=A0A6L5WFX5_9BACT|nr:glycosyltransferase [Campylobacter portucalensis]MSN95606.1 hypothetical protein [Campylobacter portucalensis]